jgi:hypothetical protein
MENKYYTPTIEEFHVGFECEYVEEESLGEKIWSEFDIDSSMAMEQFVYDYHCSDESLKGLFRVKYLDKEDIESCEFEVIRSNEDEITFKSKKPLINNSYLFLTFDLDVSHSVELHNDDLYSDRCTWFYGIIKNKSELKRILKMIGYETN